MKNPRHQIYFTYVSWVLAGFLALGTFLDAVANAVSLITFPVALIGTIIIIVSLISVQLYLNRYPLSWIANGKLVRISKLNLGLLLPFLGMLVLLWVPTALNVSIKSEIQLSIEGIRVGGTTDAIHALKFERVARDGEGSIKTTKWKLNNGNKLSATYNSQENRVLYIELDWSGKAKGVDSTFMKFQFDSTSLSEIRKVFNSTGFSYKMNAMFSTDEGIVTFNAFEIKDSPNLIAVFVTIVDKQFFDQLNSLPFEERLRVVSNYFKLRAIILSEESYLDKIWGAEKIYDPESRPVQIPNG